MLTNTDAKDKYRRPYMALIALCGAVVCALSAFNLKSDLLDLPLVLLVVITVGIGSRIGIEFSSHRIQITVSDTFIFLSLLLYGTEVAVLLATAEALVSSLRFTKLWLTRVFNAGLLGVSTFASGLLITLLFGSPEELTRGPMRMDFVLAVGALALLQYAFNSGLAAIRASIKTGQPLISTWKDNFLWTSITYFAGATAAGVTAKLVVANGSYALIASIPIIAIIYFTYRSYRTQLDAKSLQVEQAARHAEEQRAITEQLRKSEEHFRTAFDNAAVGMALVATTGRWIEVNPALCLLLGYTEEDLLVSDLQNVTHSDDITDTLTNIQTMIDGSEVANTREMRFIHREGTVVWATVCISTVRDAHGTPMHFILQAQDITERKEAEERLHRAAYYDVLTGLPNRALFSNRLETSIRRIVEDPDYAVGVLFLDLDRFKNINDSLGHVVGDQLLKAVAGRLESCVRAGDSVSRFGGDEFAILLNGVSGLDEVVEVAQRILAHLEQPYRVSGYEVVTTTSAGITLSTFGYSCPEDFLRDADTAMYRAKERGKGRYEIFDSYMHARALSRLRLENDLRYAVERGEFEVYYQPILDIESSSISGFEALIRWNHPERGLVSPVDFIPVAEDTDLIIPIGEWILREACRQTREWQDAYPNDPPLTISVNLSGRQFKQPELVKRVQRILEETGLAPACLRLEITESVVMDAAEEAIAMLSQLRSMGVQLSIDDFGTGYSSLSYLHRLPVNILKVDRSFVSRMSVDEESLSIVETIIALGSKLRMDIVAEGIETLEQLEALKGIRCRYGQGYLFAKPLTVADAELKLSKGYRRDGAVPQPESHPVSEYAM